MEIRSARPTEDDAQAFTSLYALATLYMMQRYLGLRAYDILRTLFPLSQHEHSYEVTTFAEKHGRVAGLLMGYSAAVHDSMSQRTMKLYLRYGFGGLLYSVPMILRLRPLRAVTGVLPSDAYYVKGLAVDARYRRQGIGQQLLQVAETHAHDAGAARMILDVRTQNTAALALYQACGYRINAETPSVSVNGETIAFYRMEKGL